jgi:ubiquinone/menaquinone biosynthesis C-methylase UbiE
MKGLNILSISECYICPRTQKLLEFNDQYLETVAGDNTYPSTGSIPFFLKYSTFEHELNNPPELVQLNTLTPKIGWYAAMKSCFGVDSEMMNYTTNVNRAGYLDLLDLKGYQDVLEIGVGLGQHTVELAKKVRSVKGIDVVLQNAIFTKLRCEEEGLNNVTLCCGGDDNHLPYTSGSFDFVVMNLVFEWAASRNQENPEQAGQKIMLKEINRVLKPGGVLYLNTKNRYALRLLIGKRDEHANLLRFGHALPSFLLKILISITGNKKTGGTLHSYPRLKGMLTEADFSIQDSYWAVPEMRYPTHFVRTEKAEIKQFRCKKNTIQGEFRSTNLLMRLIPSSLVKYFTPGLLFLATKN